MIAYAANKWTGSISIKPKCQNDPGTPSSPLMEGPLVLPLALSEINLVWMWILRGNSEKEIKCYFNLAKIKLVELLTERESRRKSVKKPSDKDLIHHLCRHRTPYCGGWKGVLVMSPRSSKVLVKPTILRLLIVSFFFCFGFNCYLLLKAFSLKKNLFLFAVSVCLFVPFLNSPVCLCLIVIFLKIFFKKARQSWCYVLYSQTVTH